jgi:hypothetical protein
VRGTSSGRRSLRVRVLRAVALTGAVPAMATRAARPASIPAARASSSPVLGISGTWTELGFERPTITAVNDTVLVDMSFARRPDATGTVLDATRILVTFPDAGTFLGVLRTPTFLCWSNGSSWQKVFTDPQIFDLAGSWVDQSGRFAATIGQGNGRFSLDLGGPGLHGVAFATSAATIRATFPGDVRRLGALEAPDRIEWSDGTTWRRTSPGPGERADDVTPESLPRRPR